MKRFLLPLVALSIALTSCSRDNDDVINNPITNPVEQGDLLAEITTEEHGFLNDTYFSYDGDKIQSSRNRDHISYTYNGNQITNINFERGHYGNWSIRYIYNPNGTLKTTLQTHTSKRIDYVDSATQEIKFINNKTETSREYTYTGNIVKVKQTSVYSNDRRTEDTRTDIQEHTFTLDNGNIIKQETEIYTGVVETITYTYDDKINPLNNIKGFSALNVEFRLIDGYSQIGLQNIYANKNNITSQHNSHNNSRESNVYEYNSKGYPTKKTNTSEGYTNIYTYKYK